MIRIKELRTIKGIQQKDLADVLNVGKSTLCQWESGKREPDIATLKKIADYFEVSVDYLLGNDEESDSDDELTKYLEQLRTRPEMRMMFSLTSKATKTDVEKAVRIIEALLKNE